MFDGVFIRVFGIGRPVLQGDPHPNSDPYNNEKDVDHFHRLDLPYYICNTVCIYSI